MRRLWIGAGLAVALFLVGPPAAGAEPPEPLRLTVAEATRMALARHPRMQAALARLDQAAAEVEVAAAPARPQVRVTASREQTQTPLGQPASATFIVGLDANFQVDPTQYGATRAELEARQLLFDGGRIQAVIEQARSSRGRVEQQLVQAAHQLNLEVREAWLEALEARGRQELARESEELARALLRQAEALYEAGAAARADVVFARVPVARAEEERARVGEAVASTEAALDRLLGLPLDTPLVLEEPPDPGPPAFTLAEASERALSARAEVRAAEAAVEAAGHGVDAAHGGNDPSFYAVGSYSGVGYDEEVLPVNEGWRVALEMTWTPFDGNRSAWEAARARAAVREAEADLEDARQEVLLEVKRAWLAVETAGEALEAARVEVEKASEALDMAQGRYSSGVAPFLEVSQARVDLLDARTRHLAARYAWLRARARLDHAVGDMGASGAR